VLEDLPLDLRRQSLPLLAVSGGEVLLELVVQCRHAVAVLAIEAAASHKRVVPVRPGAADTGSVHDDLDSGPLLHPALQPFQKDPALHDLELRAYAYALKLRNDALAARIIIRNWCYPVDIEAIGKTGFCHQLLGLGDIVLPFRPFQPVLDLIVYPVAVDPPDRVAICLVDRVSVDCKAYGLPHALVVERAVGVLKAGEFEPPIAGDHRSQGQLRIALDPIDQFTG